MNRLAWVAIPALFLCVAACSSSGRIPRRAGRKHGEMGHGQAAVDAPPVLYNNLGNYSYRITTASPEAQRWFDQGLRLVYGFNHHEAQRAFARPRASTRSAPCATGASR